MSNMKQIVLAKRPVGAPVPDCFRLEEAAMPTPSEGEFLVENLIFSMDAGVRGFLDDRESYLPPVKLGAPVNGMTLARIVDSRNPKFKKGQFVRSMATWSEYSVLGENSLGLEGVNPDPKVPLKYYMGALGPVGLTAWVGMRGVADVQAGEAVVVSAAAGATGSLAGQIGTALGARVLGLAGSDAKVERLSKLGFAGGINYNAVTSIGDAVSARFPDGANVYFDNVGGKTLEAMLPAMAMRGRVVLCGMISQYNDQDNPYGVRTLWEGVARRLTLRGFLLYDFPELLERGQAELEAWVAGGQITPQDKVYEGIERIPEAFIDLMTGRTMGKTLVSVR